MVVEGNRVLRCAITDLSASRLDSPRARRIHLRAQVRRWAVDGVDIVQLRDKQLKGGERFDLTQAALDVLHGEQDPGFPGRTRLLLNGRPDIAAAARADGVHLTARGGELTPGQVRDCFAAAGLPRGLISASCHTLPEVEAARDAGADYILFGPVFEKRIAGELITEGAGLTRLAEACSLAGSSPILALGGVTEATVEPCLRAGAAGIAGIRLFAWL